MVKEHTLARLRAVLSEIARLESAEFPRADCRKGLELIKRQFTDRIALIEGLTPQNNPDVIQAACGEALQQIFLHLPLLGFFLRSTNVRNAFELHDPLYRLAKELIGPGVRLVLSSEWEFSPFTYKSLVELPDFVLIGMPASESGNGLVLPLAGHELGHAVWAKHRLAEHFQSPLVEAIVGEIKRRWEEYKTHFPHVNEDALLDLEGQSTWAPTFKLALSQLEETFCDFIGVRIFFDAYLHAFAYLLVPGLANRSPDYPSMRVRAQNVTKAAQRFGTQAPTDYVSWFCEQLLPSRNARSEFLCSLADKVLEQLVDQLLDKSASIAEGANIPQRDDTEIRSIVEAFRLVTPASEVKSLASIATAGWVALHDQDIWKDRPDIEKRKLEVLNELVLKNVEVLEIEALLHENT
ncbi:MAG: hypothetical protein HYR72_20790 [Deltaproteobacteria bacterium]|nr:hypothetical protein [Deltaproteobacteria bacterium]MBI3389307.1 hypothetical protein [Deltaproteobacteria bacterium]